MPSLRTLLILGRTSNLPTVWSNCLAGWWLGGRGNALRLIPLMAGATLLYLGGMVLNDAFDASFDAQYRRERPIPSGAITVGAAWRIGFGLLAAGLVCWFSLGPTSGILGVGLVLCILIYDAVHKVITLSPVLMAGCRFLLYLAAASATTDGVTGWPVWCGFALAGYIVGLSYIARKESKQAELRYWPLIFLALPVGLALIMNPGSYQEKALLVSAVFGLWVIRCLRYLLQTVDRNIGRTVSGLLAGIVWVDLLAVANIEQPFPLIFIGLFLLALLLQRFVPAT
jgi:hypothetical protein